MSNPIFIVIALIIIASAVGLALRYFMIKDEERENKLLDQTIYIPVLGSNQNQDENNTNQTVIEPATLTPDVATQPAPSCLALGVARSIREAPEYWVIDDMSISESTLYHYPYLAYSSTNLSVRHHVIGTRLQGGIYNLLTTGTPAQSFDWISINGNCLDSIDAKPIIDAIMSNPIGQFKERLAREAEQKAIADRTKSYFSHLGCPPDEDGTKDIRNVL